MNTKIQADFFKANRERLCQNVDSQVPVVLAAHGILQRSADTTYPFQQDSSFWYLTGLSVPDIFCVIDGHDEYLIVPARESIREVFDGAVNHAELTRLSGINTVMNEVEGWQKLTNRLKVTKRFATLEPNPSYMDIFGIYTNPARAALVSTLRDRIPGIELIDIRKLVAKQRMIKQEGEIQALQQAIDITIDSISDAVKGQKLATYKHEYELEAEVTYGFRKRGAEGEGFEPIVAAGVNATTIHYLSNNGPMPPDALVIVDVSAAKSQYVSDISRTYSIGGHASKRQEAVHAAVAEVQDYAYGLLKPGVLLRAYEKQVETYMGEKLRELGLINSDDREAIRKYYPHACSHFLGIDAHDAGNYDTPLEPGMVLTVEPGIYIPEEGIGVRIEDDVLITKDGNKIISAALPRSLTA